MRLRHTLLLSTPGRWSINTELGYMRLLSHIANIQVDILRFHSQDALAILLYEDLARLVKKAHPEYELLNRLLVLLRQE